MRKSISKIICIGVLAAVISSSLTSCTDSSDNSRANAGTRAESSLVNKNSSVSIPDSTISSDSEKEKGNSPDVSSRLNIGDIVTFGQFQQEGDKEDKDKGVEPIQWEVLDIKDGKALILSRYILDNVSYNEPEGVQGSGNKERRLWLKSDIHKWLNSDFYNSAFTEEEKSAFSQDSSINEEEKGVFLLSYDEAVKYFDMKETIETDAWDKKIKMIYSQKALCTATPYADRRAQEFTLATYNRLIKECNITYDKSVIGNEYSIYWLRTSYEPEDFDVNANTINDEGTIRPDILGFDNAKSTENGVRPAVWVNVSDSAVVIHDGSDPSWLASKKAEKARIKAMEDSAQWSVKGNKLIITCNEIVPSKWSESTPWKDKAASIKEVEINGVKKLDTPLLLGCKSIKKVTFDNSLKSLSKSALAIQYQSGIPDVPKDLVIIYGGKKYTYDSLQDHLYKKEQEEYEKTKENENN